MFDVFLIFRSYLATIAIWLYLYLNVTIRILSPDSGVQSYIVERGRPEAEFVLQITHPIPFGLSPRKGETSEVTYILFFCALTLLCNEPSFALFHPFLFLGVTDLTSSLYCLSLPLSFCSSSLSFLSFSYYFSPSFYSLSSFLFLLSLLLHLLPPFLFFYLLFFFFFFFFSSFCSSSFICVLSHLHIAVAQIFWKYPFIYFVLVRSGILTFWCNYFRWYTWANVLKD